MTEAVEADAERTVRDLLDERITGDVEEYISEVLE